MTTTMTYFKIPNYDISCNFYIGLMVEVVEDKNRQMAIMYEIHAGSEVTQELTAKGIGGHIGINKTVERISSRFFWPDINGTVRKYVNTCLVCQIAKECTIQKTSTTMTPVPIPPKVMSQIGIDLMKLKPHKGMNYIISVVDYFTKYCKLGALPNKEESTVATWIYDNIFCR